jgi:hypothetical protein
VSNTATQSFNFTVLAPPPSLAITSANPPSATVGLPYTFTFTAEGGTSPYSWSLATPIPGLTLDPTSGILSGTPTVAGVIAETVTVKDSAP